jgi:hypothetical protein
MNLHILSPKPNEILVKTLKIPFSGAKLNGLLLVFDDGQIFLYGASCIWTQLISHLIFIWVLDAQKRLVWTEQYLNHKFFKNTPSLWLCFIRVRGQLKSIYIAKKLVNIHSIYDKIPACSLELIAFLMDGYAAECKLCVSNLHSGHTARIWILQPRCKTKAIIFTQTLKIASTLRCLLPTSPTSFTFTYTTLRARFLC